MDFFCSEFGTKPATCGSEDIYDQAAGANKPIDGTKKTVNINFALQLNGDVDQR
jgi:hypothetical protein